MLNFQNTRNYDAIQMMNPPILKVGETRNLKLWFISRLKPIINLQSLKKKGKLVMDQKIQLLCSIVNILFICSRRDRK